MALAGQNQVRQFYLGAAYPGHTTVAALKAGTNGDLALLSQNGTAIGAGKPFVILHKNNKGTVLTSDVVKPSQMLYSRSRAYAAQVLGLVTVSGITATVNDLFTVEIAIKEMGSYSVEDEYIKKAFYKVVTGNTAESVVDGLVQSLARNFKREEPTLNTTTPYILSGGGTVQLADNPYFWFYKGFTDGTAEVGTITVTAAPTVAGTASVAINGVTIPISMTASGSTTTAAAEIAYAINLNDPWHTATSAAAVVTVTAIIKRVEVDMASFSAGTATSAAATLATTVPGVAGTAANAVLVIREKNQWVGMTYQAGKRTRTTMPFTVNVKADVLPTLTVVAQKPAVNSGYDIADMEWYLKGERNDYMREMGYPHNFTNTYDATYSNTYNTVELGYFEIGRDEAKQSKKAITIAMPVSAKTQMNTMITNLNTILGAGSITALA